MFEAYKRYADFQGRASRSEYWLFALFMWLVMIAASIVGDVLRGIGGELLEMVVFFPLGLFLLASLMPSLAVAFRRLHDTDRSAWWVLIGLIPFIGGIVLLIFYVLPSTPGPNRFGPAPGAPAGDLQETFA
jgi:uncharacterized membrane protein YhaH (DUF805 family)